MFVCGSEEPMQHNRYLDLLSYGPQGEDIWLWDYPPRLNRYSLVWWPLNDYKTSLPYRNWLLLRLLQQCFADQHITEIVATVYSLEQYERIPSLHWVRRHQRAGWSVTIDERQGRALAYRTSVPTSEPSWEMDILLVNMQLAFAPVEQMHAGSIMETLFRLAYGEEKFLSQLFLDWLAAAGATLVYKQRDDLGRWGTILVTPARLGAALRDQHEIIQDYRDGQRAYEVWRLPPSYGTT